MPTSQGGPFSAFPQGERFLVGGALGRVEQSTLSLPRTSETLPLGRLSTDNEPVVGRKHKTHHPSSSEGSEASLSPRDSPRHHGSSADEYDSLYGSIHGSSAEEGEEPRPSSSQKRSKTTKAQWTSEEDFFILASLRMLGTQWPHIASQMSSTRTADGVRNRWNRLQQMYALGNGGQNDTALDAFLLSKGWTPDMGIPAPPGSAAGAPTISPPLPPLLVTDPEAARKTGAAHGRSMWSAEEDRLIEEGVRRHGWKWRQIAAALPGRSDSSIRNRWMRLQKEMDMLRITSVLRMLN